MQHIIVFCGSSMGKHKKYQELAGQVGEQIAKKGFGLIYGGATCGLMGVVADMAIKNSGTVKGYIPDSLIELEIAHKGLSELHETVDMHERKAKMYEAGDIALVLPGGTGSMDEFFEFLVWKKLNLHKKKIVLFNAFGYYDPIIEMMDRMEKEGFTGKEDRDLYHVVSNLDEFWTFLGS